MPCQPGEHLEVTASFALLQEKLLLQPLTPGPKPVPMPPPPHLPPSLLPSLLQDAFLGLTPVSCQPAPKRAGHKATKSSRQVLRRSSAPNPAAFLCSKVLRSSSHIPHTFSIYQLRKCITMKTYYEFSNAFNVFYSSSPT